jgi:hypothetical protein
MIAEVRARSRLTPFPCDTESERAFGRTHIATGIPIRSRPVTSATLVIPSAGRSGLMRVWVSAGSQARKVPPRSRFTRDHSWSISRLFVMSAHVTADVLR